MSIIDLMSNDLRFNRSQIEQISEHTSTYYSFIMLKGRPLEAPDDDLKLIQTWIYDFVRDETEPLPDHVTAYEPGRSIIRNAQLHQNGKHLLTLDIKHFFHSWKTEAVRSFFEGMASANPALGITMRDVELLASLATTQNHLPMGSPCSPAIANRLMLPCDELLRDRLSSTMTYSRYSDDIAISSAERIDVPKTVSMVESVLKTQGLHLNKKKTRCTGTGGKRRVTGVYISPEGKLSIGSVRRRALKALIYEHLMTEDGKESVPANRLIGLIGFCQQIEPDFVARLISKYSNYGRAATAPGGLMDLLAQEAASELTA